MKTGAEAKTWRIALALAVALFVVARTVSAWAFPIFNDEALYLQYAQAIHDDWQKNKFISMGGLYQDWKPPLQYWIAAPFIRIGGDPLYAGRAVALVASLAGLFGFYLFAKELFGRAEGVIAALLYALCPAIAFQNLQFTAETFLFSTTAFFYLAILKGLRHDRQRWVWLALSVAIGTALLLFKQSAVLALALAIFLPTVRLRAANDEERGRGAQWKERRELLHRRGRCAHRALLFGSLDPAEIRRCKGAFQQPLGHVHRRSSESAD
ncbi:MAG: glycosyltransferase family 39 protein [Chthoniobacterales bacterium]|nr:glycosyltransferase family 39 protein [Chthoniobacterales bacterium]